MASAQNKKLLNNKIILNYFGKSTNYLYIIAI